MTGRRAPPARALLTQASAVLKPATWSTICCGPWGRTSPLEAGLRGRAGHARKPYHGLSQPALVWPHGQPGSLGSLDLIQIFEEKRFESQGRVILTSLASADVNAFYPSIRLERGMAALSWFMNRRTLFSQTLKDLCLKLHFVLTNNYVECKELGNSERPWRQPLS